MSNKQKINELAETLKAKGLACSMADALEKAKCILDGIATPDPKKKPNSDDEANKKALDDLKRRAIASTEQQTNSVTQPKIVETHTHDPRIDEINKEVDMLEAKKDPSQIKLEENYDIMQDDRTLGEIMKEAKQEEEEERDNEANKETDEYSEENDVILQESEENDVILQESEESEPILQESNDYSKLPSIDDIGDVSNNNTESDFITTKDEEEENNEPNFTQGLMEEGKEITDDKESVEEDISEKEKPTLTEEEKEAADLSKIFNVNK